MNALSVITMFFPRNSVIIAGLLFGVLFFGVYIPWEERKKKKKSRTKAAPGAGTRNAAGGRPGFAGRASGRPGPRTPGPEDRAQSSQLDSLLEAGLLTREEYEQRKQQLLKK